MNDNFRHICNYLGWGDPNNGIIFLSGFEEALEITNQDIQIYQQNAPYSIVTQADRNEMNTRQIGKIRDVISKICSALSNSIDDWRIYKNNFLWEQNYGVMNINLLPLGKAGQQSEWPTQYQELFGYGANDYERYIEDVKTYRFPLIRNFINHQHTQIIICFGKTNWNLFKELFELHNNEYDRINGNDKLLVYNHRYILTPFLISHTFSDADIEVLVNYLESLNISLE